uniref:Uncharacterized protein n=1 Tax=Chromera velia CCMP2878 TaxID=1169474 RepID=A0A0G4I176_9ALVE|eukprot:Cvel_2.t1-p1 / transcript=Cvel_2.t1 / gene=Cvel_2 / organism=Chromera_velia_CCMP2878 / gene_product=hypothetical protein / transcript_product=hypothetical protein / location=Cvel_scaffold5:5736-10084(+) / protein_length=984 / sequence_SO=supercontig / SO=protein_coding / is_pseudo=false
MPVCLHHSMKIGVCVRDLDIVRVLPQLLSSRDPSFQGETGPGREDTDPSDSPPPSPYRFAVSHLILKEPQTDTCTHTKKELCRVPELSPAVDLSQKGEIGGGAVPWGAEAPVSFSLAAPASVSASAPAREPAKANLADTAVSREKTDGEEIKEENQKGKGTSDQNQTLAYPNSASVALGFLCASVGPHPQHQQDQQREERVGKSSLDFLRGLGELLPVLSEVCVTVKMPAQTDLWPLSRTFQKEIRDLSQAEGGKPEESQQRHTDSSASSGPETQKGRSSCVRESWEHTRGSASSSFSRTNPDLSFLTSALKLSRRGCGLKVSCLLILPDLSIEHLLKTDEGVKGASQDVRRDSVRIGESRQKTRGEGAGAHDHESVTPEPVNGFGFSHLLLQEVLSAIASGFDSVWVDISSIALSWACPSPSSLPSSSSSSSLFEERKIKIKEGFASLLGNALEASRAASVPLSLFVSVPEKIPVNLERGSASRSETETEAFLGCLAALFSLGTRVGFESLIVDFSGSPQRRKGKSGGGGTDVDLDGDRQSTPEGKPSDPEDYRPFLDLLFESLNGMSVDFEEAKEEGGGGSSLRRCEDEEGDSEGEGGEEKEGEEEGEGDEDVQEDDDESEGSSSESSTTVAEGHRFSLSIDASGPGGSFLKTHEVSEGLGGVCSPEDSSGCSASSTLAAVGGLLARCVASVGRPRLFHMSASSLPGQIRTLSVSGEIVEEGGNKNQTLEHMGEVRACPEAAVEGQTRKRELWKAPWEMEEKDSDDGSRVKRSRKEEKEKVELKDRVDTSEGASDGASLPRESAPAGLRITFPRPLSVGSLLSLLSSLTPFPSSDVFVRERRENYPLIPLRSWVYIWYEEDGGLGWTSVADGIQIAELPGEEGGGASRRAEEGDGEDEKGEQKGAVEDVNMEGEGNAMPSKDKKRIMIYTCQGTDQSVNAMVSTTQGLESLCEFVSRKGRILPSNSGIRWAKDEILEAWMNI